MSRFPFPDFPTGWFHVAYSRDVPPGSVVPLQYFGQELICYRGESGRAQVMDAFCPHPAQGLPAAAEPGHRRGTDHGVPPLGRALLRRPRAGRRPGLRHTEQTHREGGSVSADVVQFEVHGDVAVIRLNRP